MRRRIRPVHFARLRVSNLTGLVKHAPQPRWPRDLQLAYAILEEKCRVPAPAARNMVCTSVEHALACAQAINRRALLLNRSRNRAKVRKTFSRLAKCAARAPASLRKRLDGKVKKVIPEVIDTEMIEAIIDAAYRVFSRSRLEPAKTALRALCVGRLNGKEIFPLKAEYPALDLSTRRKCEAAVSSVTRTSRGTTAAIFKAITAAIDQSPDPSAGLTADAGNLITDYVVAVAALWRENKLPVTRATRPRNTKYKSRFHCFAEFVLTAVAEPGSNRHSRDIDDIARRLRDNHARLPAKIRQEFGKTLRREDREWLVSEDHLRKALASRKSPSSPTQKTGQDTP